MCALCFMDPTIFDDESSEAEMTLEMLKDRESDILANLVTNTIMDKGTRNSFVSVQQQGSVQCLPATVQLQQQEGIASTTTNDRNSVLHQPNEFAEAHQNNNHQTNLADDDILSYSEKQLESPRVSTRTLQRIQYMLEEEVSCSICLQEYDVDEEVSWSRNPECRHGYHKECITRWLLRNDTCPKCRKEYLVDLTRPEFCDDCRMII
mmetsp:Transcript_11937/g.14912  ORF Transcript_11937/g.14912 Transcript_11937/m.14912 type:complete len:207 (-) Transcript_11937:167-787(-)|eukprot:CAMPEP_0172488910 /NCGR_PEP_ID=MMETSP1066-20121228/18626_1 /TAXON_ID=671091 /ORGANISM="Coscinodiscus wailesii, Strain CCMP2513" /LENGTH=206 /DNA_ID=CAMNT_0013256413 /DNA_START=1 /DNA_END=621 /DNA_ORIENTATION=+